MLFADSEDEKKLWLLYNCVEARALLEPGPSFCWGPALEGSTSPSSWFFYTLGKVEVDKIHRRQVRRSRALPTPARASPPPQAFDLFGSAAAFDAATEARPRCAP